ncbi:DUF5810 domain-containing protein [Haloplanus litoreus]|uniref:DUF5810 domain-containing protein n=1 Tax=Haloplanus litoreus TaxID=767515 RepID=UPI00360CACFB
MGYACPVCETPQRDAEHLANHLAFTAMLHGDAHERWLDERVPEWADLGADDLAPAVADHADETGYDEVFEESIPEEDTPTPTKTTTPRPAAPRRRSPRTTWTATHGAPSPRRAR